MNSNQSKPSFQSKAIRGGLIQPEFFIRINPNHSDLGLSRINSEWKFGLDQSELGMIWVYTETNFGLTRKRAETWRKIRIGLYSETMNTIRFILISVSEPIRIIPKQSKIRFVSRLMKNGEKLIQFYPRHRSEWRCDWFSVHIPRISWYKHGIFRKIPLL